MEQGADFIAVRFTSDAAYRRFAHLTDHKLQLPLPTGDARWRTVRLDSHDYELHSLALHCGARIAPANRIVSWHST